jgi:hypothetical protein
MRLALKFISGKYQGAEVTLPTEGELLVGRAPEVDLALTEDMVSRRHARFTMADGQLTITDLGSTNGTFVNGEKVRRAELGLRDRILIGTSILKVVDASELATDAAERDDVRAMMARLAERAPDSHTMSGELTEVPLPDLLQLFATNQKSGVLTLSGAQRGKVYVKAGKLIYAVIAGPVPLSPMKALCRMLGWDAGSFVLEPWDERVEFADTFTGGTEGLLIEGLRQVDELRLLMPKLPAPTATLKLCVPMMPKLSSLGAGELDVLQLVLNFGTLEAVLDRAPGSDLETSEVLADLLAKGYLEPE